MRTRSLVALVVLALVAAGTVAAQAPAPERLDLNYGRNPLRGVLTDIAVRGGLSLEIADDVPNIPVKIHARGLQPDEALRLVVRVSERRAPGLTLTQDGERRLVSMRPGAPPVTNRVGPPPTIPARDRSGVPAPLRGKAVGNRLLRASRAVRPTARPTRKANACHPHDC